MLMHVHIAAHDVHQCLVAHLAIECSQTVGVEGHSLDGPDLRRNLLAQCGIKHMHLASGLLNDVLLECCLPVRPASTSPLLLVFVQHLKLRYITWTIKPGK